ncbi:MAG TPA: murein L,D-transpeptidase catalytic domain family protein [Lacibacter sp.]|nr:murein L,D-transpeptidase catalytic domain family protein [Lacibacter sp.]
MKPIPRISFVAAAVLLLMMQLPIHNSGNAALSNRNVEYSQLQYLSSTVTKTEEQLLLEMADSIYLETELDKAGLDTAAFHMAFKGYAKLLQEGRVNKTDVFTIADFSKSSSEKRLYVIDMQEQKILFHTLVAHGRNSGLNYATQFSNKPQSNKSSLGFYITMDTYFGGNGYSLKLQGLEKGINDKALQRAIVMHGSDYVNNSFGASNGFIGRSFGCPAVPRKQAASIINTIKNGSVLFIYHPNRQYISTSTVLNS